MTATISKDTGEGVHRLIDMVVEEVSLVDRAANNHRFLIVKRDDAMDDTTTEATAEKAATDDVEATESADETQADGDSPLGAAIAALESLTAIVELLSSTEAGGADERLATLAEQLRTTAEGVLKRAGLASTPDEAPATVPATTDGAPTNLLADVTAAKDAISRLADLAKKALPLPTEKRKPEPPAESPVPAVPATDALGKLAESFKALAETVKEQQQRLGRVEKHFGLPNSAAPGEAVSKVKPTTEAIGWPMDLNQPKDRESVDKAVSFHDV